MLPYTPGTGRPTKAAPKIIYRRQGASSRHTTETPYPRVGTVVRRGEVAQNVRVVPRHVYEARGPVEAPYKVPAGFTRVFEDGRLNPHRAEMTFAGMAASDTILERDVPRTLINRRTGEAYVVSSKSSVPYSNPPVVSSRNSGGLNTAAPVVSSRSVPVEKTLILAQRTYVHVETYSNGDAAQKAAKQMQRLGLPAKIGKYNASGQTRRMVLVGPFMNTADAGHALTKAQKAGYSRASIRN